ncbi:DUF4145 domain-containing protein [Xanthomonas sacchari]|uniref:DUF4145 domain-containing protein n=1 Tax=Xanthomonas sacchari TaxID=56458 RepID=UPI002253EEA9|nr:DUF4145 domain-containing protein [Xanthomonas sacchari]
MAGVNWTCPHCERHVTITEDRFSSGDHRLWIDNADGPRTFVSYFYICPNPECKRITLTAALHIRDTKAGNSVLGALVERWDLIPSSSAKSFPSYIPAAILADYREACLIRTLSPKASATLSRRCLQGALRDFWSVKPGRLVDEIEQIRDKVDPLTWSAIDSLRKLGNIGAHMEKDINLIVDVDPQEAELLVGLVETLLRDWYITREERNARMSALVSATAAK